MNWKSIGLRIKFGLMYIALETLISLINLSNSGYYHVPDPKKRGSFYKLPQSHENN